MARDLNPQKLGIRQAEGLEVAEEEGIPGKQTLKLPEPQSWKGCVGVSLGVSAQVKCSSLPLMGLLLSCLTPRL